MTKKEIIELYLADLNNLVPNSDAKRSRIIDLEDELEALLIHDIAEQKQHLIDMMRYDEELGLYDESKQEIVKDLGYWKANAEEDYMKVPISILRYISELENQMCIDEEVFNLCRAFATFVAHKDPSYKKQQEWFEQFKKR